MSLDDLDAVFSGSGAKSAFNQDTPLGTSITGTILDVSLQQITDYVTKQPKFWDGDRPQMQMVLIIQTQLNEGVDDQGRQDDGRRAIYIKTWGLWKENLMKAVRAAGFAKVSDALAIGNKFTDTFTGTKPSAQGSPTKVHEYRIQAAAQTSLDDALAGADPSTGEIPAAVPVAPPVQAAPVSAPAPAAVPADDPVAKARQLIAAGVDDATIAQVTALDPVVLNALRNAA